MVIFTERAKELGGNTENKPWYQSLATAIVTSLRLVAETDTPIFANTEPKLPNGTNGEKPTQPPEVIAFPAQETKPVQPNANQPFKLNQAEIQMNAYLTGKYPELKQTDEQIKAGEKPREITRDTNISKYISEVIRRGISRAY